MSARGFVEATAVHATGDGGYRAAVDPHWGAPTGPNGGYLAAIVARAAEAEVNPKGERRLRSLTTHYMRPASAGELDLAVAVSRRGRRLTSASVIASQGGRELLRALVAFAVPGLEAAGQWSPAAPEVPGPPDRGAGADGLHDYEPRGERWLALEPDSAPSIVQRVRIAPMLGGRPFSGVVARDGEAPSSGGWVTLPEPHPIDSCLAILFSDVWWPPAFEPLEAPAIAPTIDLTVHVRADLGPEGLTDQPVLGIYRSTAAAGGLVEEDGQLYGADGTLIAQSRQLALLAPAPGRG